MSPRWDEADRGRGRGPGRDAGDAAADGPRRGRRGDRWRLFVASYPPMPVRVRLAEAANDIHPELRCVDPEAIHLTWVFIGDVAPSVVPEVDHTIARAVRGIPPLPLAPQAFEPLPDAGRPRLVAAVADPPPGMLDLQARLATRLTTGRSRARSQARPASGRDRRPFRPHLTVGRWPGGRGPRPAPAMPPVPPDVAFLIDHLALVRSRLRPEGAEHVLLGRQPLGTA